MPHVTKLQFSTSSNQQAASTRPVCPPLFERWIRHTLLPFKSSMYTLLCQYLVTMSDPPHQPTSSHHIPVYFHYFNKYVTFYHRLTCSVLILVWWFLALLSWIDIVHSSWSQMFQSNIYICYRNVGIGVWKRDRHYRCFKYVRLWMNILLWLLCYLKW